MVPEQINGLLAADLLQNFPGLVHRSTADWAASAGAVSVASGFAECPEKTLRSPGRDVFLTATTAERRDGRYSLLSAPDHRTARRRRGQSSAGGPSRADGATRRRQCG